MRQHNVIRFMKIFALIGLTLFIVGCISAESSVIESESLPTASIAPTLTPTIEPTAVSGSGELVTQTIFLTVDGETEAHDFLLYLPEEYDPEQLWPLIIYLHGAGSRGDDIERIRQESFLSDVGRTLQLPAIVVAPQAPTGTVWDNRIPTLEALLDAIETTYPIDTNRIILTGFSMGGFGTWAWGLENPGRFAAIVPVAGGFLRGNTVPLYICDLQDTAVWAFASAGDTIVPASRTEVLVDALVEECGAENIQITVYEDVDHGAAGTLPYLRSSDLYDWLWEQSLSN